MRKKLQIGFVLNGETKNVSLTYKDQYTEVVFDDASFVNKRQEVKLNVYKKDAETNVGLPGAEFGLYAKEDITNYSGEVIVNAGDLIETAISDENGLLPFKSDLPLTKFEIKELKAPKGYASNDKVIDVDATYQGQDIDVVNLDYEFKNEITKVEVSKQDITNSEEIEGAHLTVFEKDNPEAVFDSWISGCDGKNENGTIKSHLMKGLEVGKTYILREEISPYGFALAQDIEFTIKDTGKVQSVVMKDELVYGKLEFLKTGEIFNEVIEEETEFCKTKSPIWNEANIPGAKITIYAAEDIKVGNTTYYRKNEKVQTLKSSDEIVSSRELPVGLYFYIESSVPYGFLQSTDKRYFRVEDNKINELQIISSTLENERPKFNINMKKVLEEQEIFKNEDAYKDIVFGIFAREDILDYSKNVAIEKDSLISISGISKDGTLENVPDLPDGLFYLKELSTNGQYVLNDEEYDFKVFYNGKDVAEYTIQIGEDGIIDNKLARGTIQVKKVDSFDESKILEGVKFNLATDKEMKNIIRTEITNEEGIATFDNLELGIFYIQEDTQLETYVLNGTIYEVEVKQNGDLLVVRCENKPTEMFFSKVDETGTNELPGAKLQIIDKETGEIIDEWISTAEQHIVRYLVEGRQYIMREIQAPKEFDIAEEIVFTAFNGSKVIMKDMRKPVVQTGNETNYILLISSIIISLLGITTGIIILKRKRNNQ